MEHRRLKNGNKRDGRLYHLSFYHLLENAKVYHSGNCVLLENPGKWKL